jgi:hypothetical protein
MHSNNGTGTRKMSLDAMGARLAEATQKLTPEARERLFFGLLADLQKPFGALETK